MFRAALAALLLAAPPALAQNRGPAPPCLNIQFTGTAADSPQPLISHHGEGDGITCNIFTNHCQGSLPMLDQPARIIGWSDEFYLILTRVRFDDDTSQVMPLVIMRHVVDRCTAPDPDLRGRAAALGLARPIGEAARRP